MKRQRERRIQFAGTHLLSLEYANHYLTKPFHTLIKLEKKGGKSCKLVINVEEEEES